MTKRTLIAASVIVLAGLAGTGAAVAAFGPEHGQDGGHGQARFERMLKEVDSNGDGLIQRSEMEGRAAARFTEMDTNGDGALSREEMQTSREAMRAQRMQERFATMDTNGDGQISPEEMAAAREGGRGGWRH
jgi:Ca2+-binding EF-hand superfamily protein